MIATSALQPLATLHTDRLRLEPLGPVHLDGSMELLTDPEGQKMTATRATFTRDQVLAHLERVAASDDRADWAIIRTADDRFVGEVVLNDLSVENESMNYRISLVGPEFYGRGYGTEAGRAVVDYGLDVVGLHRISLDVFDFNPRGLRSYEKIGFRQEGVFRDALRWDGEWYDEIWMAILATDPRPTAPGSARTS